MQHSAVLPVSWLLLATQIYSKSYLSLPNTGTLHRAIPKARDIRPWLQPCPPLFNLKEFINQSTVVPRSVWREHLGNGIALSISLDPKISCKRIDVLHNIHDCERARNKMNEKYLTAR